MTGKRAKTGGRKKGTPNKISGDLRELVLGALSDAGGRAYLRKQADENPSAYMSLLGKCLPKEITGADGAPLMASSVIVIGGTDAPN
jgi:hypothetical protein